MLALFFTLPEASALAPLPENRCGGRRVSDLTCCAWRLLWSRAQIHGAGSRVWDVLWKARGREQFNGCAHLPSQHPLCPNYCELLHLLTYLLMQGETCWEDLLLGKKKKPNKIDSAFRTEHDQVRGCPGIVHRMKHSLQCLNALQKAAMSDTTEKKCWTHRNWSPHLWEHINPNTSISHDENYRRSGIYLFA